MYKVIFEPENPCAICDNITYSTKQRIYKYPLLFKTQHIITKKELNHKYYLCVPCYKKHNMGKKGLSRSDLDILHENTKIKVMKESGFDL
jgi:hypothetical protein